VRNLTADLKGCLQVGTHSSQFKGIERAVRLAIKIVTTESALSKRTSEEAWKRRTAKELDIDLEEEEDEMLSGSDEAPHGPNDKQRCCVCVLCVCVLCVVCVCVCVRARAR
jgi:hypothetical protein